MTREEIRKYFPNASKAFLDANASDRPRRAPGPGVVSAPEPEFPAGGPLERPAQGEAAGPHLFGERAYIEFHVWAVQPADWDNSFTKPLQDLLITAGLLASDAWDKLQGRVVPHRVKTKAEQRTEIKIWYC
jgi:hypothetical protein